MKKFHSLTKTHSNRAANFLSRSSNRGHVLDEIYKARKYVRQANDVVSQRRRATIRPKNVETKVESTFNSIMALTSLTKSTLRDGLINLYLILLFLLRSNEVKTILKINATINATVWAINYTVLYLTFQTPNVVVYVKTIHINTQIILTNVLKFSFRLFTSFRHTLTLNVLVKRLYKSVSSTLNVWVYL